MRTTRRSRSTPLVLVVAIVVVVGGFVLGVGFYGGALGLPHPFSSSGASPSDNFGVTNITLATYPAIDDGFTGLSASAYITNHGTTEITNATVAIGSLSLGTCSTLSGLQEIQPGQQILCKLGNQVNCDSFPTPPYAVKVTVKFSGGGTNTSTTNISSALTDTC